MFIPFDEAGKTSQTHGTKYAGSTSQGEMQKAFLQIAIKKYERMSVLASEAINPLLNTLQRSILRKEFDRLRADIYEMRQDTFNGNQVFRGKIHEVIEFFDSSGNFSGLTWDMPKQLAETENSADLDNEIYLGTIRSYAGQVEVKGQVGSANKNAWLGANDVANEGDRRWVTSTESADG